MKIEEIIVGLIFLGVIVYLGVVFFVEFTKTLWAISPISSIGFVISVIIAILKGHMRLDKWVGNLRILLFIFVGAVFSHEATSLIPNVLQNMIVGDLLGAFIIGLVVVLIWFKGNEIKGWE